MLGLHWSTVSTVRIKRFDWGARRLVTLGSWQNKKRFVSSLIFLFEPRLSKKNTDLFWILPPLGMSDYMQVSSIFVFLKKKKKKTSHNRCRGMKLQEKQKCFFKQLVQRSLWMQVVLNLQEFTILPPSCEKHHPPLTTWAFSIIDPSHLTPTAVIAKLSQFYLKLKFYLISLKTL